MFFHKKETIQPVKVEEAHPRFAQLLLARLYPFQIGAILGGAYMADRLSNFSRYPGFDRYQEKSRENLTRQKHYPVTSSRKWTKSS